MYYLRTRPAAQAIQFTVDQRLVQQVKEEKEQLKNKVAPEAMGEAVGGQEVEGEGVGAVPMAKGKVDTESEAYKEALLACSRENREACIMCSA